MRCGWDPNCLLPGCWGRITVLAVGSVFLFGDLHATDQMRCAFYTKPKNPLTAGLGLRGIREVYALSSLSLALSVGLIYINFQGKSSIQN